MNVYPCMALLTLLVPPSPLTLRYKHVPGHSLRFTVRDRLNMTNKVGVGPETSAGGQESEVMLELKVISASATSAVVEERRNEGRTTVRGRLGSTQSMAPPAIRRITFGNRGEVLKWERVPVKGVPNDEPGFLEGLTVPLPEKPVAVGESWSGVTSARGIDGKPLKIRYTTRFAAIIKALGHTCARMESRLTAELHGIEPESRMEMQGTLSGGLVIWFALDIGQDIKADATVTMSFRMPSDTVSTMKSHVIQELVK